MSHGNTIRRWLQSHPQADPVHGFQPEQVPFVSITHVAYTEGCARLLADTPAPDEQEEGA